MIKLFHILLLLSPSICFAKVVIMTSAYNRPEFIELQYKTFKNFIENEYEYIVFSDAEIESTIRSIENECLRFNIPYIRIPQDIHKVIHPIDLFDPYSSNRRAVRTVFRQGDVLSYMFDYAKQNHSNDIIMIIDSDVFLIKPLDIEKLCEGYAITSLCGYPHPLFIQSPWPPQLALFNMPLLPDKNSMILKNGFIGTDYLDPFEFLQFYVDSHKEIKIKSIKDGYGGHFLYLAKNFDRAQLQDKGFSHDEIDFIFKYLEIFIKNNALHIMDWACFYGDNKEFCNFDHGSNWDEKSAKLFADKLELFLNFFGSYIN